MYTAPTGAIDPKRMILAEAAKIGVLRAGKWLVRNVDLVVRRGEIVTLVGPNGSGKTTTAKVLLGLVKADEGRVTLAPSTRIGYVPQKLTIDRTLPLTVKRLMTITGSYSLRDVETALSLVGVSHLSGSFVDGLSGGEFQRVLLARALVRKPDLLVLDEPVQGVDFSGEIALYELVQDLREELNCGILLISHDLHVVMAKTDSVVCLNGHVCCSGAPSQVAASPEYQSLFGPRAAQALAVYRHEHNHKHAADGTVIPLKEPVHADHDCDSSRQRAFDV